MLSKDTSFRLVDAVTDPNVADEIAARLISATPADDSEAQAVLDILDTSKKMNKSIAERLYTSLAGDAEGRAGREISHKINGMVAVLKAQADSSANLAQELKAMGNEPMSDDTFFCLTHALCDKRAATEFRTAYDAMIVAVQAIT